jgi:hypothetical protein
VTRARALAFKTPGGRCGIGGEVTRGVGNSDAGESRTSQARGPGWAKGALAQGCVFPPQPSLAGCTATSQGRAEGRKEDETQRH